ncbi:MAG TPA: metal-dependent hydrolase [Candidatus Atribacteria bacterium]|nr:metal-dependent hydrolase [Candidatus Atribacteria bacterium]
MTSPTHITFSILFTEFILTSLSIEPTYTVLALSSIASLLPDIDTPKSAIGRIFPFLSIPIEHKFGHRQITHSWIFIALCMILFLPFLFFKKFLIYSSIILGVISHILIDMANPSGVPFFYPYYARFVFPENKSSRIEVGSKKEFILLAVLIFITTLTTPISFIGYKSLFYRLSQTTYGAIEEAKKDISNYQLYVQIQGIWKETQQPLNKEFKVLAVLDEALVINQNDRCYLISYKPFTSILIKKISLIRKQKIKRYTITKIYSYCLFDQIDIPRNSIISGFIFYEGYQNIKDLLFSYEEKEYPTVRLKRDKAGNLIINKLIINYCPSSFLEKFKQRSIFVSYAILNFTITEELK